MKKKNSQSIPKFVNDINLQMDMSQENKFW